MRITIILFEGYIILLNCIVILPLGFELKYFNKRFHLSKILQIFSCFDLFVLQ